MQGTRTFDRKRIILFIIIPLITLAVLIAGDQITKFLAEKDEINITVIDKFFYLNYATNSGAGFSFLADKPWGQTVFLIVTPIALVGFLGFYLFAFKKSYKWLACSITLIIAGTIGNFIDRVLNGRVVDFLSFQFGSYFFPTFNVADICLTVGVIMLIIHFIFLDESAIFKKKPVGKADETKDDENV